MSLGDDQNNSDGDVDDVGPYCYYTSSFEGCKVGMDVFWSQFVQHVALREGGGVTILLCVFIVVEPDYREEKVRWLC